jgi:signal transduction histidine kinase
MMKAFFTCALGVCMSLTAMAQDSIPVIQLSKWSGFDVLDAYVVVYIDSTKSLLPANLNSVAFKKPAANYLNEPVSRMVAAFPHYYKIRLKNDTADTLHYFILGAPQKDFQCYQKSGDQFEELPLVLENQRYVQSAYVAKFTILPAQEEELIIHLKFPFYNQAYVYLWMAPQARIREFFIYQQALLSRGVAFQWFICGMLVMMFVYIILKYVQIRTMEYFYYALYIFFFLIYFGLKLASAIGIESIFYSEWYGGWLNNQLQVFAYIMYFLFFKSFLNTRKVMPRLDKLFTFAMYGLVVYIMYDSILFYFPQFVDLKEFSWNVLRLVLVVVTFSAIYLIIKSKSPLGWYLVVGGFILAILGICAMIFSINPTLISSLPNPFETPITYFQIGVLGELTAFTLGLGYKNRMDEQEKMRAQAELQAMTERQEFERYRTMTEAREEERTRIAKDLHDGVGGLLSGVKMSLTQMQNRIDLTSDDHLLFARSLDMLDGSMQEIRRVSHAMMPPSLQQFGLKAAVRDFIEAINSMKTIDVVFQVVGAESENYTLDTQLMIYRIIQELINNVLKHSHANKCLVQLVYADVLTITVEDDGVGFEQLNTKGAGLINIRQRVEFLKGTIDWNSTAGEGTSVLVEIPLQ